MSSMWKPIVRGNRNVLAFAGDAGGVDWIKTVAFFNISLGNGR